MRKCEQCGEELPPTNLWFCDINCEQEFRNDNKEFHALVNQENGDILVEEVCPVIEFSDDSENGMLIVHNGSHEYRFDKSNVTKWEITPCTCLVEFMDIEGWG